MAAQGTGRPSKYKTEFARLAFWIARTGATDKEIAAELGVAESTLHLWKKKYSDFSEALKNGKEAPDNQVEAALFKRAIGFEYEETKITAFRDNNGDTIQRVEKTTKQIAPDTTACIFHLKNRRPEKWRDKQQFDINKENGLDEKAANEFEGNPEAESMLVKLYRIKRGVGKSGSE